MLQITLLVALALQSAAAQEPDSAYRPLQHAYDTLREKKYDQAVTAFRQAIELAPNRPSIRKDLAYTLLKVGENEAARDQFAEAMRLDPADQHVALEYAFLCYETKQQAEARRIFDRIRKTGDATAEQAFQNIDQPLADGHRPLAERRWKCRRTISARIRSWPPWPSSAMNSNLAAEHYEKAWKLRPDERSLMLDLGRVWKLLGRDEEASFVLLAASRGGQPRVAEQARELLPARYPYVYEFEKALQLDPKNFELRREYAYLLLADGQERRSRAAVPDPPSTARPTICSPRLSSASCV